MSGFVETTVVAGPITKVDRPPHPNIGQQFTMGRTRPLTIQITPEVARQWIQALETIAEQDQKV